MGQWCFRSTSLSNQSLVMDILDFVFMYRFFELQIRQFCLYTDWTRTSSEKLIYLANSITLCSFSLVHLAKRKQSGFSFLNQCRDLFTKFDVNCFIFFWTMTCWRWWILRHTLSHSFDTFTTTIKPLSRTLAYIVSIPGTIGPSLRSNFVRHY